MNDKGAYRTAPATPGLLNVVLPHEPNIFVCFRFVLFQLNSTFNRPGVAGAVLQTASSISQSVTDPFPPNIQTPSIPIRKS